ncbi:iron-sulfur cluster carrier protein ApbC [Thalassotalea fonticola]|uniref:Iron-sulfur cluster carrier protein n=2 Tax=Thalassotalea fonticola TaxID=3065649 RepID=A0ABZ0GRT8_9GAMM|nr:iron-sulfur cluster carrier protein ApbC [Colwelliaceae bacterium S1-1]
MIVQNLRRIFINNYYKSSEKLTIMFKNPFSSNKPEENVSDRITEFLSEYQSELFPGGVINSVSAFNIAQNKQTYILEFTLPFPCQGELEDIARELVTHLDIDIELALTLNIKPVRTHNISGIKNIIAIASGKGGVGKSTTSVNLAYALMAEGAKVGILDADIYGPSIPTMLGIENQRPSSVDGKLMQPLLANGLTAMSIGFLVSDTDATVWRGPMASSAFSQMLNETAWQGDGAPLDYLIIDMPPGTGDIQLTLAQKVPVAAATIVTTPQDIALKDAVKGINMFDKVKVPVLGVIENMSYHLCENCGHHSHLFGQGGAEHIASQYKVDLLGQLPLNIHIREDSDAGKSSVLANTTSEITMLYRKIARNMAAQLYNQLDANSPYTAEIITVKNIEE